MQKWLGTLIGQYLLVAATGANAAGVASDCLEGRYLALKTGGFSGLLSCDRRTTTFSLIGEVVTAHAGYLVYHYQYRFKATKGGVLHGNQRIVVFDIQGRYMGQYALTAPPHLKPVLKEAHIMLNADGEIKGDIDFSDGPPSEVYIDGDKATFFK